MDLEARFGSETPLIGMVHLPPLPGAPRFAGDRQAVRGRALSDAYALVEGGFDALLVENFGDAPFYPEEVPSHVVAEMTAVARELDIGVDRPIGVNVLRNDVAAALSVAAAAGGSFVRANVHSGARVTDQGLIEGRAHETMRLREQIEADVVVFADVAVKHSTGIGHREVGAIARETLERGLADGLIVSGPETGEPAAADHLQAVLDARDDLAPETPVFVGSGVTAEDAPALLEVADGVIVGTALKRDGVTDNPVEPERVQEFVEAARSE
jgi:membrane complex biogenesis BtpA family protein